MKIIIFLLIFIIKAQAQTNEDLKNYLNIIEQEPGNYQVYIKVGLLYVSKNNFEEAKNYFEKAITLNNNDYHGYYNLGLLYYNQDKMTEALTHFKRAYLISKTSEVYISIINCFIKLKSYDFAQRSLSEAFKTYPQDYKLFNTGGVIALLQNNFSQAKEYFLKALTLSDDSKIKSNLAITEYYLGNKNSAKQTLKNLKKDLNLFNENFNTINKASGGK